MRRFNRYAPSLLSSLFAWIALLGSLSAAKPYQAEFPAAPQIIAIGDIHGDFPQLIAVLKLAELVDDKLDWIGEDSHLVQLGDLPDRGPDTLKIIEFLKKLEKRARRKGGHVHILIGNHDAMNVYGDLRYVTESEYKAFATHNSQKLLQRLFDQEVTWIKKNEPPSGWPDFDGVFKEQWFAARPPGYVEHRANWLPNGKIGKWVLSRNAVMKIGNTLFVHGGISSTYSNSSIEAINQSTREALRNVENVDGTILRQEDGPLWYRGLARDDSAAENRLIDEILANYQVDRVVMGHTPTGGFILPRLGGKAILADVGMARHYGSNLACLKIENGRAIALYPEGELTLPTSSDKAATRTYLENLLGLKRDDPRIQKRIQSLLQKL